MSHPPHAPVPPELFGLSGPVANLRLNVDLLRQPAVTRTQRCDRCGPPPPCIGYHQLVAPQPDQTGGTRGCATVVVRPCAVQVSEKRPGFAVACRAEASITPAMERLEVWKADPLESPEPFVSTPCRRWACLGSPVPLQTSRYVPDRRQPLPTRG